MMRIPDSKSFAPTLFHHDNSMCSHRHRRHTVNTMATDPIKIYWLPLSIGCDREERTDIQEHAVDYLAEKICQILPNRHNNVTIETAPDDAESPSMIVDTPEGVEEGSQIIGSIAKGRFVDMTCSKPAENLLESLFVASPEYNPDVIEGAIIAMQSLLVFGMQVGIKGPPETLQRLVQHLRYMGIDDTDDEFLSIGLASRRLKFNRDHTAAIEVLAKLKWKRTSQGAFGLLVKMGVWSVHEDLALLRSGFPTGFVQKEEEAAKEATDFSVDQDSLLGIRKDLRSLKVYTIDGESTKEVDDGLSVERIESDDGSVRHRFWVFISDADRWAGRTSRLFKVASRRATTLYQPTKTYYMFPESVAFEHMSLKSNQDSCALSMSLELLPSGEIDVSSIDVMTSTINVDYRLTYDDVDEMLDEGVGYSEEWQLGALLDAAKTRRQYRCNSGSIEGLVDQIPRSVISTNPDPSAEDGVDISVDLEVSHNAGKNMTTVTTDTSLNGSSLPPPASSANLLVTEMMIMAGEAMGKWAIRELQSSGDEMMLFTATQNFLQLEVPYRSQPAPAFRTRELEANRFWALKENNDGNGYCASWYIRRFLEPVSVDKEPKPHACMGLECYGKEIYVDSCPDKSMHLEVQNLTSYHGARLYNSSSVDKSDP